MKKTIIIPILIAALTFLTPCVIAQIDVDVKGKVTDEADRRANTRTDEAIDKGFDKVEEGIKNVFRKKDKKETGQGEEPETAKQVKEDEEDEEETSVTPTEESKAGTAAPSLSWSKYDFVPGDHVIFEDNLQNEENGEFPSRWDLVRGNAEVAEFGGEKVIMMRDGHPSIIPYLKDPEEDYLPDVFTVEFDLYYPGSGSFEVYLYDRKNQDSESSSGYTYVQINNGNQMQFSSARSNYPGRKNYQKGWMHISIAYTDGKLKAYMDDTRLINLPRIDFNPKGLTLYTYHASDDNLFYIKNVRIAKGGVKYYDRVMQDGKIIVNGIKFDVNKSTLKPESMGPINEIYTLMKNNTDLKFSVEGHTDSQGDDDFNLKLSQARAETVMNTLIKMGVSADRLSSRGWGESKPISGNDNPEGMANNRRVEFVKM